MPFPVDNIRKACKAKGITLAELERKLNIGNGVIARWEKAKNYPPYDRLVAISEELGVSLNDLSSRKATSPAPQMQSKGYDDEEIRAYLQQIKDDPSTRMMFDLAKGATLEEIKATVAFLKTLREQG